jgi:uncharacterized protein YbaR (Trm112 family)
MELSRELLEILRCPESREPLIYFPKGESGEDESLACLYCPASRLKYRVDDGIPVMLVEEAERLEEAEGERLHARARELGLVE